MPPAETTTKLKKKFRLLLYAALLGVGLCACSNIDCPLDNIVVMTCNLYSTEDDTTYTMTDTLTITAAGTDSVLLNRAQGITSFALPVSYNRAADTLLLHFSDANGRRAVDSLIYTHSNFSHFENLDCPASIFHNIGQVRWTSHALGVFPLTIDSVAIIRGLIDYDDVENLRIYLRSTASE